MPRLRPVQARPKPAVQLPLLPVPQQGWPAAPQVPHWLPVVPTKQVSGAMHWVMPASGTAVQQTWPLPPQGPHMPGTLAPALRPPQPSPLLQVPALLLPQQIWPEAPQVAVQTSPLADSTQVKPVLHSVAPPQQA
jgi:hypothetical protein